MPLIPVCASPSNGGSNVRYKVLHVHKYKSTLLGEIKIKTGSTVPHPIDLHVVFLVEHGKWEGAPDKNKKQNVGKCNFCCLKKK